MASPKGTHDCVSSWLTDFRKDLARIDIPVLIVHGDADRICPLSLTGKRMNEMIKGSKLVVIEGAPHGLSWTHAEQLNHALLDFLGTVEKTGARMQPEEKSRSGVTRPSSRQPPMMR